MEHIKDKPKNTKKDFNPKDAIIVFSSFTAVCLAVLLIFVVYDILTIQSFLSFEKPLGMAMIVVIASIGLLLFGMILASFLPSKYIDDTNKSYQNYSLMVIFFFMFLGALFEEILFRGITQNLLFIFIENQWIAIVITTLLFVGIHTQYFKNPIMLINIAIPSLVFGWVYFETNNILVPLFVHFLMNFGITLIFKYGLISLRR